MKTKPMTIPEEDTKKFKRKIKTYFKSHGRDLPWRHTTDPYHILVSEIMLQQTQVERVIDKYTLFIQTFPSLRSLAKASLNKLLGTWQGLGYNRRALLLQKCARQIIRDHGGAIPDEPELLEKLPGLGKATSSSICAFAFNKPVIFIETNIRTVFIHEFFPKRKTVHDDELFPLIEKVLDRRNPCAWYSALMDYGTHLKKQHPNPSRKSVHHTRQSKFEGSDRQVRGKVLKLLLKQGKLSFNKIQTMLGTDAERLNKILEGLMAEGFIVKDERSYTILP